MGKRLTITDYIFAFLFIFMFFCIIVAFFYGVNVGKTQAAEEYEQLLQAEEELPEEIIAYHQQHLVSFYYNVYSPFATFQDAWFRELGKIAVGGTADVESSLRELSKIASESYQAIEEMKMPATSPLLQEAQTNYLRSLRLFKEVDQQFKGTPLSGLQAPQLLSDDPYIAEAIRYAVAAQDDYYEAIVRWHQSVVLEVNGVEALSQADVSLDEWQSLPFNVKNSIVAKSLNEHQIFAAYTPQDMTAVLSSMIETGRTDSLGLETVSDAIVLLHETNAVRSGDYFQYLNAFEEEVMPQLPFFSHNHSPAA